MPDSNSKIRIVIIEDHAIVRQGVRRLLDDVPDFQVIADTEFGEEGVRIVQDQVPDIVLLDLLLDTSQLDGLETLRQILASSPTTRVVILTVVSDEETVIPAIRAGAIGYILKLSPPNETIEAIRDAARGVHHLDPVIIKKLIKQLGENPLTNTARLEDSLTAREQEILPLLAEGHSNAEIAQKLTIAPATVKTHVSNILRKLQVRNRTQVAQKFSHRPPPRA